MDKYKTVKWFKEGDKIPLKAKLIRTETRTKMKRPPQGGSLQPIDKEYFLYEYEVEEFDTEYVLYGYEVE